MKQERKNNINVIKRLSREASSVGDSSFGSDYHRDSPVSVPFVWESEPGTPKHKFHDQMPLPPLTPPPSYKLHSYGGGASRQSKPTNLIYSLFPRKNGSLKKGGRDTPSSSAPSSSPPSQWSSSSSSTPENSPGSRKIFHGRRSSGQRMTSFDSTLEEEEEEGEFGEFSVSGLFNNSVGDHGGGINRAPYRGCCSAMMKIFKR